MLRRIAFLFLLVLMSCAAPAAPLPTVAPPPTQVVLPDMPAVGATVLNSDIAKTRSPQQATTTSEPSASAPVATSAPVQTPAAVGFDFSLRPQFKQDLNIPNNKTVYTIRWELNDDMTALKGTQRVIFVNRTGAPLNQVYFRLFANYPGTEGSIDVTKVQISGRGATTELEAQNTALRVELGRPLAPERMVIMTLDYDVKIPREAKVRYSDFISKDWITTLPTVYPIIPAFDAKGWHLEVPPPYGDLVYADSSVYDVTIVTPSQYKVIASGQLVQETPEGARIARRFLGAPMRDFNANITNALQSTTESVSEDVTVTSWYLPNHVEAGKRALGWTVEAMKVYEKRFGPYPFKELDLVETPTTAGGIEYPGLITVASNLYADPGQLNFFEFATAHETAHEWFYSTVGNDQINNPWLDEAMAQYATLVYFDDRYGAQTAQNIQENFFDKQYDEAKLKFGDLPAGLPVGAYNEESYGAFVYSKGPKFFQAVRAKIGDDAFFKALATYYNDFKYRIATPADLVKAFNTASGQDITSLYDEWIAK